MSKIMNYDRENALKYSNTWALRRNPDYYDYTNIGGDCTNYISQCLYAGSQVMNEKETFGWYYHSANEKSPSWTGVTYLYNFLVTNKEKGPFAEVVPIEQLELGDLIQLRDLSGNYYHTLFVAMILESANVNNIYINAHDFDAKLRPLNTYQYAGFRCLKIKGVYM